MSISSVCNPIEAHLGYTQDLVLPVLSYLPWHNLGNLAQEAGALSDAAEKATWTKFLDPLELEVAQAVTAAVESVFPSGQGPAELTDEQEAIRPKRPIEQKGLLQRIISSPDEFANVVKSVLVDAWQERPLRLRVSYPFEKPNRSPYTVTFMQPGQRKRDLPTIDLFCMSKTFGPIAIPVTVTYQGVPYPVSLQFHEFSPGSKPLYGAGMLPAHMPPLYLFKGGLLPTSKELEEIEPLLRETIQNLDQLVITAHAFLINILDDGLIKADIGRLAGKITPFLLRKMGEKASMLGSSLSPVMALIQSSGADIREIEDKARQIMQQNPEVLTGLLRQARTLLSEAIESQVNENEMQERVGQLINQVREFANGIIELADGDLRKTTLLECMQLFENLRAKIQDPSKSPPKKSTVHKKLFEWACGHFQFSALVERGDRWVANQPPIGPHHMAVRRNTMSRDLAVAALLVGALAVVYKTLT